MSAEHHAAKVLKWGTVASLLAVTISLATGAAAGHVVWWALALDAWAVFAACIWIARGFRWFE